MDIGYRDPLGRGFARMKRLLFAPFDLQLWLVVGFAAWLAGLGQDSWGGLRYALGDGGDTPRERARHAGESVQDLFAGGLELVLLLLLGVVALVLTVAVLWLNARGRFVLLDDLLHGRGAVREPWRRWSRQADSFFLWQVAFLLASFAALGLLVGGAVIAAVPVSLFGGGDLTAIFAGGLLVLLLVILGAGLAYVQFFAERFVAPLMLLHGCGVVEGWRRFGRLFRADATPFLMVGLLYVGLWLVIGAAVMALGLFTCCLGWGLLALPYVGSVIMLPVTATLRFFDLEFLAQFGPEADLLARFPAPAGGGSTGDEPTGGDTTGGDTTGDDTTGSGPTGGGSASGESDSPERDPNP
ncbi:MAG: hypothetical protein R6X25_10785 [Candidatus Krumholzibacteriia bacterium]